MANNSQPSHQFPHVLRLYTHPKPCYHCPFLYDDANVTIGRRSSVPRRPAVVGRSGPKGRVRPEFHLPAARFELPEDLAAMSRAANRIRCDQRQSKGLFLIANLELEFHLTHRKLSPLQIPNRKFSSLLYLFTNDQSRVTSHRFLIHGTAIKTQRNPFKNNNLTNSNRRQTGGLRRRLSLNNKTNSRAVNYRLFPSFEGRRFTRAGFWCAA